jgi:acetyl-CoA carboxylase biotin carboxyl carrier protein
MIDLGFLEKLLDLLNRSEAQTIEIRRWTTTIRISKGGLATPGTPVTYHVAAPAAPAAAAAPAAPAAPAASAASAAPAAAGAATPITGFTEIKSPMVGTFYAQPEPGAEPYVRVGSRISPGQTLCIIEAMKIMNQIQADRDGTITAMHAENGQPVEFDQPLFTIA